MIAVQNYFRINSVTTFFYCMCLGHVDGWLGLEVKGQREKNKCVCYTSIYCDDYRYRLTAVVVGFHCNVVAWPRPAAAANSSARGRGNAVGLTSVLERGQFFSYILPTFDEFRQNFASVSRKNMSILFRQTVVFYTVSQKKTRHQTLAHNFPKC